MKYGCVAATKSLATHREWWFNPSGFRIRPPIEEDSRRPPRQATSAVVMQLTGLKSAKHEDRSEDRDGHMNWLRKKTRSDLKLISLQYNEVRNWMKRLGCTEAELHEAVKAVGRSEDSVRQYLAGRRR